MASALLKSLWFRDSESWVRQTGVGDEPLYSPYITSPSTAAAAQAVNRSSGEHKMESDGLFDEAGGSLFFLRIVVAALAFLVWDILITTDEEVTLFPVLILVDALDIDLVHDHQRLNSYGRTFSSSLSMENIGLITVPIPQTIMVIHQSRLFLHTICSCDGRNVRLTKPSFFLLISLGGFPAPFC